MEDIRECVVVGGIRHIASERNFEISRSASADEGGAYGKVMGTFPEDSEVSL